MVDVRLVAVSAPDPPPGPDDALVIPCFPGPRLAWPEHPLAPLLTRVLSGCASSAGFAGRPGQCVPALPADPDGPALIMLGVAAPTGEPSRDDEELRAAASALSRSCPGASRVLLPVPGLRRDRLASAVGALTEGALIGAYRYRATGLPPRDPAVTLELGVEEHALGPCLEKAVSDARCRAMAVNLARDLVNAPPNRLYPRALADAATAAVAGSGVEVTVLDHDELARQGYGGLVAVGAGAGHPPCLAVLRYRPPGAMGHVCLVGKGITYDSGGLCLKPKEWLHAMKADMAGAAVVIGVLSAVAGLGIRAAVTGYLPVAENAPSGSAMRPGDVVTMRDGHTVEVTDTDAEGRIVLADALTLATEEAPQAIVTVGTLFSGALTTFGPGYAPVISTAPWLAHEVTAAADAAGERTWRLPLPDDYRQALDSQVADLRNYAGAFGDPLHAALFMREFTSGCPWLHLDVIGPGWVQQGSATGFGVRSLLNWLTAGPASGTPRRGTAAIADPVVSVRVPGS